MTRPEKEAVVAELKGYFEESNFFYLTDPTTLTVAQINKLRRQCFDKGVKMVVAKNTLIQKALETAPAAKNYAALFDSLKGQTAILFTDTAKTPATLLKDFRKGNSDIERPALKAAYIDTAVFIGDNQLDTLAKLKSKEELLGEVIGLLQSPAKNLISALKSGGSTIAGLVKALEERAS